MNRFIFTTIALLLLLPATAQPCYFGPHQVGNGLSNNTVYCSVQDNAGFLWFGTKERLNRSDGYRFRLFHLDADAVRLAAPDHIHHLFAGQDGEHGVFKNNPADQNSLANNTINAICEASRRNLWLITEGGGLCGLNVDGQQGTDIDLAMARSLAELHVGRLYLKETAEGFHTPVLLLPLGMQQPKPSGCLKRVNRISP